MVKHEAATTKAVRLQYIFLWEIHIYLLSFCVLTWSTTRQGKIFFVTREWTGRRKKFREKKSDYKILLLQKFLSCCCCFWWMQSVIAEYLCSRKCSEIIFVEELKWSLNYVVASNITKDFFSPVIERHQ